MQWSGWASSTCCVFPSAPDSATMPGSPLNPEMCFLPLHTKNKLWKPWWVRARSFTVQVGALVGEKWGLQNQHCSKPSLPAPVLGGFSCSLRAQTVWALPGDMLVTEEGQEERLWGVSSPGCPEAWNHLMIPRHKLCRWFTSNSGKLQCGKPASCSASSVGVLNDELDKDSVEKKVGVCKSNIRLETHAQMRLDRSVALEADNTFFCLLWPPRRVVSIWVPEGWETKSVSHSFRGWPTSGSQSCKDSA